MRRTTNPDRATTTANVALHGYQGGSRSYMAIVSPCSVCKNFTTPAQAADPATPQCPRRIWMDQAKAFASTGDGPKPQSQLTASGTDDPDQLVNPAYDDDSQTIAVWVATLDSNPGILDPAFDTTHIQCELYPVAPQESQAQFFSLGVFHESDQILVTAFTNFQQPDAQSDLVQIRGFARKVNFANSFTGTLSMGSSGGRPITGFGAMPAGASKSNWGSEWKTAALAWRDRVSQIGFTGEHLAYRQNYMDLDPRYRDKMGDPLIRFTLDWTEHEHRQRAFAAGVQAMLAWALGVRFDLSTPSAAQRP